MLKENKEKFDYCGITKWHESGYTGEGVKIGIVAEDYDVNTPTFNGRIKAVPYLSSGETGSLHGFEVAHVLLQVVPSTEFYFIPITYPSKPDYFDAIKWAYTNGIKILSMSNYGMDDIEYIYNANKWAIDHGMTLICAGGNHGEGEDTLGASAKSDLWISVGACEYKNGVITRASYSSTGKELDICGFTDIAVGTNPESPLIFNGTSAACPFIAGMVALWFQYYKEQYNKYPTHQETKEFLIRNCEDLDVKGVDNRTGAGLFRLPDIGDDNMFKDINSVSNWAKDSVLKLEELGLMKGDSKGNFNPKAYLTREEFALVIDKLYTMTRG